MVTEDELNISNTEYSLTASIEHIGGTPTSGHYIAHVRESDDEKWIECNDWVLTWRQGKDRATSSNTVLLLFVKQKNPDCAHSLAYQEVDLTDVGTGVPCLEPEKVNPLPSEVTAEHLDETVHLIESESVCPLKKTVIDTSTTASGNSQKENDAKFKFVWENKVFEEKDNSRIKCGGCNKEFARIMSHVNNNEKCSSEVNVKMLKAALNSFKNKQRLQKHALKAKKENLEIFQTDQRNRRKKADLKAKEKDLESFQTDHRKRQKKADQKAKQTDLESFQKDHKKRQKKADQKAKETDLEGFQTDQKNRRKKADQKAKQTDLESFQKDHKKRQKKSDQKAKQKDLESFQTDQRNRQKKADQKAKEEDEESFLTDLRMRRKKAYDKSKRMVDASKRLQKFNNANRFGPVFVCSCCHQKLYESDVEALTEEIEVTIKEKTPGLFEKCIPDPARTKPQIIIKENGKTVPGILPEYYICKSCKRSLLSGKIPKLSSTNNLQVDDIPPGMELSELEANMIAKSLIFQKIHKKPKSRWAGTHDRMINIPIYDEDILRTVEKLPRTPTEASIISVKLKRKMGYKGHHTEQIIDSRKVFKYLNFLKESGHPSNGSFEKIEIFERRCEEEDPEGFLLIHPDYELLEDPDEELEEVIDEILTCEEDGLLPDQVEVAELEAEEEEYLTHDAVRKFQIDHDSSSVMTKKFPETGTDSMLCFAPGEGKVPTNILNNKSWDIYSFPHLFPSGDHGMFSNRDVSLKDQEYLSQRLCNKDTRFEQCPPFVFASAAYLEEKQMSRNIGLSFNKGKVASKDGKLRSYQLDDCYGVLDNCKNTPRYHQKNKYNMLAALDNFGPFHLFFTLSCADLRWTENFTSILREKGWTVVWDFGANSKENAIEAEVKVLLPDGSSKKLDLFLQEDADESLHESIRTNVFTATRTFMKRVTSFKTHILMGVNSPMNIKRFSWKIEYQGRGAGHVHGVA